MAVADFPVLVGARLRLRSADLHPVGTAPVSTAPVGAAPPRVVSPARGAARPQDAEALQLILGEPSVVRWWGAPPLPGAMLADLAGESEDHLLVIEVDGRVVGGIQYSEELGPMYRHAGIDIFLGAAAQGRGIGREAVALLAGWLIRERGHHRLTIDPAADNVRAIRCYTAVGFRPVGVLREYERGPDGRFHDGLLMDLLAHDLTGF